MENASHNSQSFQQNLLNRTWKYSQRQVLVILVHWQIQDYWKSEALQCLLTLFWNLKCTSTCTFYCFKCEACIHKESYHMHPCIKIWNIFPKQVWVFQMNLYVNFALELSDLVEESRIISVAYMCSKPSSFPKASFGNSIVSNAKYALTGFDVSKFCFNVTSVITNLQLIET